MANNTFFFNSENQDRVYNAESFRTWLRRFFTNGIFNQNADDFQVTAYGYYHDDMRISITGGRAHIKGATKTFNTIGTITLDAPGTYPRIDNVVIEYNENEDTRDIVIKIEKGQYSGSTPYAPEPKRTLGIYQLIIAQVYVAPSDNIEQSDITDCRNDSSKCGYVACTIPGKTNSQIAAEFTTYLAAFDAAKDANFTAWFNAMKATLDNKYIGRLTDKATEVSDNITSKIGTKPSQITWYEYMIDQRITELEQQGGGGGGDSKVDYYSGDYSVKNYPNSTMKNFVRIGNGIEGVSWGNNRDCGRHNLLTGTTQITGATTRLQIDVGVDSDYNDLAANIIVFSLNQTINLSASGSVYAPASYTNAGKYRYTYIHAGGRFTAANNTESDYTINTTSAQPSKNGSVDITSE